MCQVHGNNRKISRSRFSLIAGIVYLIRRSKISGKICAEKPAIKKADNVTNHLKKGIIFSKIKSRKKDTKGQELQASNENTDTSSDYMLIPKETLKNFSKGCVPYDEEIEYCYEDDMIWLRYKYKGDIFKMSEETANVILSKLDRVAEYYSYTDPCKIGKIIVDDFGVESTYNTYHGEISPITKEEADRIIAEMEKSH